MLRDIAQTEATQNGLLGWFAVGFVAEIVDEIISNYSMVLRNKGEHKGLGFELVQG